MSTNVFVTVGSIEKKDSLKLTYGLSEREIIVSHNTSFAPNTLQQQTYKGNFDVLLNYIPTDADMLQELCAWLSNFGHLISLEKQENNARLESGTNGSYSSVALKSLGVERVERPKIPIKQPSLANLWLLIEGTIKPINTTIFAISDIETAFKTLHSGNFDGKLIIALKPEDLVNVSNPQQIIMQDTNDITGHSNR